MAASCEEEVEESATKEDEALDAATFPQIDRVDALVPEGCEDLAAHVGGLSQATVPLPLDVFIGFRPGGFASLKEDTVNNSAIQLFERAPKPVIVPNKPSSVSRLQEHFLPTECENAKAKFIGPQQIDVVVIKNDVLLLVVMTIDDVNSLSKIKVNLGILRGKSSRVFIGFRPGIMREFNHEQWMGDRNALITLCVHRSSDDKAFNMFRKTLSFGIQIDALQCAGITHDCALLKCWSPWLLKFIF
ncbi:hypothetical protein COLO4_10051 [Corchorus olitorius]|uniref:Uncharacterized protein n=1 Tax=Corchorus olitorius TaxID=93759 RepID=A0A1R3KA84_9ROSI|nr:hypothetical protein COLO4_10051 [Corchorus olitorius]